jgi:hypothetical protein
VVEGQRVLQPEDEDVLRQGDGVEGHHELVVVGLAQDELQEAEGRRKWAVKESDDFRQLESIL